MLYINRGMNPKLCVIVKGEHNVIYSSAERPSIQVLQWLKPFKVYENLSEQLLLNYTTLIELWEITYFYELYSHAI